MVGKRHDFWVVFYGRLELEMTDNRNWAGPKETEVEK
jgi:hypothetical protein